MVVNVSNVNSTTMPDELFPIATPRPWPGEMSHPPSTVTPMAEFTVVAVADVHVDHRAWGRINPDTGRSTAWEATHRCFMEACRHAVDTRPDAFLAVGDLFLNGNPSPEASEMVAEGFRLLRDAKVPTVVIMGNHELLHVRSGHRHALLRFEDIDGITVVDRPQLVDLPSGLQIACLPWPRKAEMLSSLDIGHLAPDEVDDVLAAHLVEAVDRMADEADTDLPVLLAAHAAVGEATIGSSLRGSEMSIRQVFHEPIVPVEALAREPFAHVLLGHIHKRQCMGPNAHYIGSVNRLDFSEEHEEKGFTELDIDSSGAASVRLVETSARVLRTVDLNQTGAGIDHIGPGDLVRIELPEGETRPDPTLTAAIADAGGHLVTVKTRPRARAARDETVTAKEGITPLEGLRRWAERQRIDEPDVARLVELGSALMDEVGELV